MKIELIKVKDPYREPSGLSLKEEKKMCDDFYKQIKRRQKFMNSLPDDALDRLKDAGLSVREEIAMCDDYLDRLEDTETEKSLTDTYTVDEIRSILITRGINPTDKDIQRFLNDTPGLTNFTSDEVLEDSETEKSIEDTYTVDEIREVLITKGIDPTDKNIQNFLDANPIGIKNFISDEVLDDIEFDTPQEIDDLKYFEAKYPGYFDDENRVYAKEGMSLEEVTMIADAKEFTKFDTGARKDLAGKLRMDLIPPEVERAYAEVLTFGCKKYSDRNWEQGLPVDACVGAARRHLNSYLSGEKINEESGLSHLKHFLFWAAALVTFEERDKL